MRALLQRNDSDTALEVVNLVARCLILLLSWQTDFIPLILLVQTDCLLQRITFLGKHNQEEYEWDMTKADIKAEWSQANDRRTCNNTVVRIEWTYAAEQLRNKADSKQLSLLMPIQYLQTGTGIFICSFLQKVANTVCKWPIKMKKYRIK